MEFGNVAGLSGLPHCHGGIPMLHHISFDVWLWLAVFALVALTCLISPLGGFIIR